ncbi:MAG: peptidoglycan recognition family protein [Nibricoccus sp.]
MNQRAVLVVLSLASFLVGCHGPRATKPTIEQTKVLAPVLPKPAPPPVVYTANVRAANSRLSIPAGRWKMIICHHSALEKGNAAVYDRDHRKRGMENGLAYHFVIGKGIDSGDGEIEIGNRWYRQIKGGHVRDDKINEIAIGICLVGNFEKHKPTDRQIAALKELLIYLRDEVVGAPVIFMVHTEADPGHTECPGKYFPTEEMHRLFTPPAPPKPSGK